MDTLSLYDINFQCHCGTTEEERRVAQAFSVDLEVSCDVRAAAAYDRLSDAVDYEQLCEAVIRVGTGYGFHLVETLTEGIAEKILEDRRIGSVKVRVKKCHPPMKEIQGGMVVEITRTQPLNEPPP